MGSGEGKRRPPAGFRSLLLRVVPEEERSEVDGELQELFEQIWDREGEKAAKRWYGVQVLGFARRIRSLRRENVRRKREDGMSRLESWRADLGWALRALRKRPMFTAVAVGTLALGIGANSAVFTLVSSYFLTPLPYERPDEIALIWESDRNSSEPTTVSPGNYFTWREEARSFADVAAFNVSNATLSGEGVAERVRASVITPNFLQVLGVRPLLGSVFSDDAVEQANGDLVILSHALWFRRYGGDPAVVGQTVRIDGRPHGVVGVLGPEFRQPERSLRWQEAQLWRPLRLDDQRDAYDSRYLRTVARMAPGATVEGAREEMDLMAVRMAEAYPEANAGRRILVYSLDGYLLSDARPVLLLLLAAGGAVLLIVCANVANLTLARGVERRREFAVRAALGSGRARLLRQVIVEGVVLAMAGAAVGIGGVILARDGLQAVQERYFTGLIDVGVDLEVVAFTASVALITGILFGLPLARRASRLELRSALVEGGERSGGGAGSDALGKSLVIGQVAVATTVVVLAFLLSRSFNELVQVEPGFESEGVVAFSLTPPRTRYSEFADVRRYFEDVWREVESVPGVVGVGLVSDMPFTTENRSTGLDVPGRIADPDNRLTAEFRAALPEYFQVMGIPLLEGAWPTGGWESEASDVPVLVNQRMAETIFAGTDPLSASFSVGWSGGLELRVVGVVGNVRDDGFDGGVEPIFYVPAGVARNRSSWFVVRTAAGASGIVPALREAVATVDADVPAADLQPLDELMAGTVARPRAASLISGVFAVLALLVASAGIYGVISHSVERRTREIGIRSALGASASQILSMVMGRSSGLVAVGIGLGLLGSLAAGRAISGVLFGVDSWDPLSLLMAAVVLGGVASLSAWIPARRAVRIHPRDALRTE